MTLSQIRSQVDALCRNYATELKIYRLRPLALQFSDEMADAVTGNKRGPARSLDDWALLFIRRMRERGIPPRPRNLNAILSYLERCLERRVLPQVNDLLRSILSRAAGKGLIPRSTDPVPF